MKFKMVMMYINDVHILAYVFIALLGGVVGLFAGWCSERLADGKEVFTKDILLEYKTKLKPKYSLAFILAGLYVILLYTYGIGRTFAENFVLLQYLVLSPMLLIVFVIDKKLTIIPNRLNLTMFEVGLAICFIRGIMNFNSAIYSVLGMLAGAGIFLIISLVGGLIAGKEAMGMGDVKLMGALGLYFGLIGTIEISVLAFLIGAIISVVVLILKKAENGYMPFGPFIVIATFITMIVPNDVLIPLLLKIFTLGLY